MVIITLSNGIFLIIFFLVQMWFSCVLLNILILKLSAMGTMIAATTSVLAHDNAMNVMQVEAKLNGLIIYQYSNIMKIFTEDHFFLLCFFVSFFPFLKRMPSVRNKVYYTY